MHALMTWCPDAMQRPPCLAALSTPAHPAAMPRRVALVVSLAVAGALVCCQHATAAPSQTEALQRLAASLDPKSNLGWSTSGSDPCSQSDYPGVTCVDGNVATM